jgi:FKBP-type peptidyl-prolyl cis-trans isomerase SlyD
VTDQIKVDDGQVVSMHYTLHVDGRLVDTSNGGAPLQFIQGMGHIIPGLEHQLYDMVIGDEKQVSIAPADGYGHPDPSAFMDVPRNAFPTDVPLELGTTLELKDRSGHPAHARIDSVTEDNVRLDMNHPLAGKRLEFAVKITALRPATDDEDSHGHVHTEPQDHAA